jgi:hypothetical protein
VCALLLCGACCSQADLGDVYEGTSVHIESPELYERLEDLSARPLDLNSATEDELVRIPWITPTLARRIVERRKKKGPFEGTGELAQVDGLSSPTLEKILPYVRADKAASRLVREYRIRNRVAREFPEEEGYVGSPTRLYNRVTATVGEKLSLCLLAEKDNYEGNYLDFFTGHVKGENLGPFRCAVIGDYSLDFAQGLVFSPARFDVKGSMMGKGSERGIVANKSAVETGSLRGIAAAFELGRATLYCFSSFLYLDASLDSLGFVKTIYDEGLHRTESEVARIDRLNERLVGARARALFGDLSLGLTLSRGIYRPRFADRGTTYFTFSGESYGAAGADFGLALGPTELFGEAARSLGLGEGFVLGSTCALRNADLGVSYRRYAFDFYSPHSSAFSDSKDQNEEGMYVVLNLKASRSTRISGFLDVFRSLGPGYPDLWGSRGRDARLEVQASPERRLKLKARVYTKSEEKSLEDDCSRLDERRGLRLQADYAASKSAGLATRFERVWASAEGDSSSHTGLLFYWEVAYKISSRADLRARFSLFDADSWDARIYQYESDLPGVMRNTAVSGRGTMGYLLAAVRPTGWFKLSGKLSWKRKNGEVQLNVGIQSDMEVDMD